ncbi:tetratricopeptide repeat protein [Geitlerinema sp. PCC 7407]|uniref:tetratricopeptide repeat protein n=1 Tax=Geitlerinema sp. PCC 7407 TaxID=1173025 RepID=UPI00167FDB0E|nr:tetratricopeptide repeat protein [Geitlerinema sp. PCC 7407]
MATISDAIALALQHHQAGRFDQAEPIYRQILAQQPQNLDALQLLGVLAYQTGRGQEAIALYRQALALKPNYAEVHSNLGVALKEAGDLEGAIAHCQRAVALKPDYAGSYNNLGNALQAQGRIPEAIAAYRRAVELQPGFWEALGNLGNNLRQQGQWSEAMACYQQALQAQPTALDPWLNLGAAWREGGNWAESIRCYERAIALHPQAAEAHSGLGITYKEAGQLEGAIACYERAIALQPSFAEAHNNLGNAFQIQGRLQEAIACYQQALTHQPRYVQAHSNLGVVLQEAGQVAAAIAQYRQALALDPESVDTHNNLSLALLLTGQLREGFAEYEWRWRSSQYVPLREFPQPLWDGSPLAGRTLLLHAEQGFGDTLQFIRFAIPLAQQGRVVVECQGPVRRLLERMPAIAQVVTRGEALPDFEVHAPLLSLPYLLGTTLETIPQAVPYLQAPEPPLPDWAESLVARPDYKIGLVWAGSPTHRSDRTRSAELAFFEPLLSLPGITWVSLQKGDRAQDLQTLGWSDRLLDLGPQFQDFGDTATAIAHLDLVITVDTSVAHLAGALGKPVWVLLSYNPDWRWLLERSDSPWYPTARLFRPAAPRDWPSVFAQVRSALEALTAPKVLPAAVAQTFSLAFRAYQAGQWGEAEAQCRRVTEQCPDHGPAWLLWGVVAYQTQQYEQAIALNQRVIALNPAVPEAHSNLGAVFLTQGRLEEAVACYQRAIALNPQYADAYNNLGVALRRQKKLPEAIAAHQRSLELNPRSAEAQNNLGAALQEQGQWAEALPYHAQAIALNPQYADAYSDWGNAQRELGHLPEAIQRYEQAIALQPSHADAHLGLATSLLTAGDYRRGFAEYEWRWQLLPQGPAFQQPAWAGEPLQNRRILLLAEQGLGDTIQFVRFAAEVAARGGQVILVCQPPLKALLTGVAGVETVVAQGEALPPFDTYLPLLSLPYRLGTTLDALSPAPYLQPPGDRPHIAAQIETPMNAPSDYKIGLVWAGNPHHRHDRYRSCPPDLLVQALARPGVALFSLQKGPGAAALPEGVIDLGPHLADMADTAAAIAHLDLVITVDTSVAHLAGALGKPVWILLAHNPDWRWLRDRDDSPWYASARLFRQPAFGDWPGAVQRVRGALDEALAKRQAPQVLAGTVEELGAIAWQYWQRGDFGLAERVCRQVLAQRPDEPRILELLGTLRCQQGDVVEGESHLRRAIALQPDFAAAHGNLANALKEQGRLEEAIAHYAQAVSLKPDYAEAYGNWGLALQALQRLDEAIAVGQRAVELQPQFAEGWVSLGVAYQAQQDYSQAIAHYERALALDPQHLRARYNLGVIAQDHGDLATAIAHYRHTVALQPSFAEGQFAIAFALLLQGDLVAGFRAYEWRWKLAGWPPREFAQPEWDGSPLSGKTILLHAEQGLGDTIQFVRFARQVKARGGRVLLECPPSLKRLLTGVAGLDAVLSEGDRWPDFDLHAPLLSLPRMLGTRLETIPAEVPYLQAAPEDGPRLSGSGYRVGIVWGGSDIHRRNRQRSCPLREFQALFELAGTTWYSLQKGPQTQDLQVLGDARIENVGDRCQDMADTAAAIAQLDLVITVDTSVAHLAGALGKPVWILLSYAADWRWLLERTDCPWYPTARLFRQPSPGDWASVFRQVHQALSDQIPSGQPAAQPAATAGTMALALHQYRTGQLDQAAQICHQICDQAPSSEALHLLGLIAQQQNRLPEALQFYQQGLTLEPDNPRLHNNFGNVLRELGQMPAAVQHYQRAIALDPRYGEAYCNLGSVLHAQEQFAAAVTQYRQALQHKPSLLEAHYNLGAALQKLNQFDAALECYQRAIALQPDAPQPYQNLGTALQELGRYEEAIAAYQQAIALDPALADAFYNLGNGQMEQGKLQEAIAAFDRALILRPDYADAHFGKALALFLGGDLAAGFAEYEWRWQRWVEEGQPPTAFAQPRWDGQDLQGKTILLHSEQGFGDAIQFIRYAPLVKALGGRVIAGCKPPLRRLFATVPGVDQVLTEGDRVPSFDLYCPLLSLPRVLGTTLATIPAQVPYVAAPPPPVELPISGAYRVGIVWAGSPTHRKDRSRSCPLEEFLPLFELPGTEWYSLQKGDRAADLAGFRHQVTDLGQYCQDFADTAALIAQLDLVISVDTSVAHLAGALGKPVWVLLATNPDWRWLLERADSPWYPTARLFRQRRWGAWRPVFAQVAQALGSQLAGGATSGSRASRPNSR